MRVEIRILQKVLSVQVVRVPYHIIFVSQF